MNRIPFILFIAIVLIFSSCAINKDLMFKTPVNYEYDIPPEVLDIEYRLQIHDIITFRLFDNDGFKLIDMTTGGGENMQNFRNMQDFVRYKIEIDGQCKLPIVGRVSLQGKTVREAELFLEETYSEYNVKPFVVIEVTNNRVIVMPGSGGDARVIPLLNDNTTLMEALASAGGIAKRGNASRIKLIRRTAEGRQIYHIDLSKIDGVADADMIVQAQDIIYVEPVPQLAVEILRDLAPIFAIITSTIVLLNFVR
jgi:polysaccharide biosynthesis/export protein